MVRHRNFLKDLEAKKIQEKEDEMLQDHLREHKQSKFKEHAAKQREKIKGLKAADTVEETQPQKAPSELNAENLRAVGSDAPPSQAPS